jgi:hypothetical protein
VQLHIAAVGHAVFLMFVLVESFGIIGSGSFAIDIQMGAAASMMRMRAMRMIRKTMFRAAAALVIFLGAI